MIRILLRKCMKIESMLLTIKISNLIMQKYTLFGIFQSFYVLRMFFFLESSSHVGVFQFLLFFCG